MSQGLAFIILIMGQIEQAFRSPCPDMKGKTPDDILREARGVKRKEKNETCQAGNS